LRVQFSGAVAIETHREHGQSFPAPDRIFVCGMGLVVAMLSVTGVYIWWKKRAARLTHVQRRRAVRSAPPERTRA